MRAADMQPRLPWRHDSGHPWAAGQHGVRRRHARVPESLHLKQSDIQTIYLIVEPDTVPQHLELCHLPVHV